MNKRQRKELGRIRDAMRELLSQMETISEEEREKVDNLEAEFPGHARLDELTEGADTLEMAVGNIEEGLDALDDLNI